ncbi:MAG: hypothetical protein ACOC2W_01320 [bacterium]
MIEMDTVKAAADILDINVDEINERKVFNSFIEKLSTEESEKKKKEIIGAKITLFLFIDEENHRNKKAFLIPIKNYCKKCSSKGYIPEREKVLEKTSCPNCQGTGVKTVPCKKCEGTGKINDKSCSICNGTGKYKLYKTKDRNKTYYCGRCKGTGEIYVPQAGDNIIDFEICPICKGAGFNINYPAVKTPKIKNLGEMIPQKIEKLKMSKPVFNQMEEAINIALSEHSD